MKIRLLEQITGNRDGVRWPAPGATIDLPDNEAAKLCASGRAEPVAEPAKAEKRPASKTASKR